MATKKESKKISKSKTKILDNARKRNLKMVLYKNKYIQNQTRNKDDLIETLLYEKKIVLKLHQPTDNGLHSEDENNIYEDEISRVLEQKKKSIFSNNDSDSDESAPLEILEANKRWKEEQKQKVMSPAIPRKNINSLLSVLSSDKNFSSYENNLHACLAHLHTSVTPFWNSPSCIMKAIKDCILRRKWNNLTHILLMLINSRSPNLRPLIRHLCQVLDKLHPVMKHSDLQGQLNMVYEANKGNHQW